MPLSPPSTFLRWFREGNKLSIFDFGNVGRAVARVLFEKEWFSRQKYGLGFRVLTR